MEETDWSSDFYSDIFSLDFDSLSNTIDLESLESKENSETVPEVLNTTTERASKLSWQKQTTYRHQMSPGFHLLPVSKYKKQLKQQKIRTR